MVTRAPEWKSSPSATRFSTIQQLTPISDFGTLAGLRVDDDPKSVQSQPPQPGGKPLPSPIFRIVLGFIGAFIALLVVASSDVLPPSVRRAALRILAHLSELFIFGLWGGLLALPAWAMWTAARAADARVAPPGGKLTVAPDEGPLAPVAGREERAIPYHWRSTEWILSGLGLVGEAGLIPSVYFGRPTATDVFGAMFIIGGAGWIIKLNLDHFRGKP